MGNKLDEVGLARMLKALYYFNPAIYSHLVGIINSVIDQSLPEKNRGKIPDCCQKNQKALVE